MGTLEDQPDQDAVVSDLPIPKVDLTKWGLSEISPTKMLTFSEWPPPEVAPMAATHHHDDRREVLVRVDRGDDDVAEIDIHKPLFKVTLLLAGFLPTPQFLQCQWVC